jgi:hypothetical protein
MQWVTLQSLREWKEKLKGTVADLYSKMLSANVSEQGRTTEQTAAIVR